MNERRASIYARLIEGGVIPAIAPAVGDSSLTFLERAVSAMENPSLFSVSLGLYDETYTDHALAQAVGPAHVFVAFEASPDALVYCDLEAFDTRMRRLDRELAGALVAAVDRGSYPINCVSPVSAWEMAFHTDFQGDARSWREDLRAELDYQSGPKPRRKRKPATNAAIRKHLRESGMPTPGGLRRRLGRHYCDPKHLDAPEIERRIAMLPQSVRWAALALSETARRFRRIGDGLEKLVGKAERAAWEALPEFPAPGMIIETNGAVDGSTPVGEILDERYNWDAQDRGWGPSFILVLDDSPRSVTRFRQALELLTAATSAARELGDALGGFARIAAEEG